MLVKGATDLDHHYQLSKSRLARFWSVVTADYICNISPSHGSLGRGDLKAGFLVFLKDIQKSQLKWLRGIVTRLILSKDGVVVWKLNRLLEICCDLLPTYITLSLRPMSPVTHRLVWVIVPLWLKGSVWIRSQLAMMESSKPYATCYGRAVKPITRMNV